MNVRHKFATMDLAASSLFCGMVDSLLSDLPITGPSLLQILAVAEPDIGASNMTSSLRMARILSKRDCGPTTFENGGSYVEERINPIR